MKALIDPRSNRVCQLANSEFPVARPLLWVDATGSELPDSTTYANGQFVAAVVTPVVIEPSPLELLQQQVSDLQSALIARGTIALTDISATPVRLAP